MCAENRPDGAAVSHVTAELKTSSWSPSRLDAQGSTTPRSSEGRGVLHHSLIFLVSLKKTHKMYFKIKVLIGISDRSGTFVITVVHH